MAQAARRTIQIGHSPDPDDAFMFHAIAAGRIPVPPEWEVVQVLRDIETLNGLAMQGAIEVSAVSIHAYAYLADRYALLPCGASMGDGYGPMVVAREPLSLEALRSRTIAVPGRLTSATLALRLALGKVETKVLPFDRILPAVRDGECEAGLLIHEGQLTYASAGLHRILDLGEWWKRETGLPLPLGGNAVRKDLGPDLIARLGALLHDSIAYGLAHRDEALTYALEFGRGLARPLADRFVGMYVNEFTLDYGDTGRRAVAAFLERGAAAGLIPGPVALEFTA
ncbi:MAG TPA: MqnA/MqnD/SBP family protein [Candidatus Polarisedimenticolia bacterium]|jgi:1,4-dihydroxy-6-naphthoate synthase|nr:MqnA/MqnD/SBP family protein [Candidatus Polarisedimenticolia bacterium]